MKSFDEIFTSTRVIAILRKVRSEILTDVLDALYDGGIRLAEITFDHSGKIADETVAKDIRRAVEYMSGRMYIGSGTVTRSSQVELTASVGGSFIISPNTDIGIIRLTKQQNLISIPGAMTVSEITSALAAGADYVKLFPASLLGTDFVKAVLAPLSDARLIAVSGVNPENMHDYLDAGCVGFGIGSGIVQSSLCASGDFDKIRENAHRYIKAAIPKSGRL